jgi:D-alanyl-lipoteichoic acid biosynthesis protein dltB
MEYFDGLDFFGTLFFALIPVILLRLFEKSVYWITFVLSIGIAIAVFKEQPNHFINLVIFIVETYLLVLLGFHFRDKKSTKYPIIFFASLLLIAAKTVVIWKVSILGFLGISYMTFKVLQIIFETYDGIIKEPIGLIDYLQFLLFFPTISSGPIDRSRRFMEDIHQTIPREEYVELLGTGLFRLLLGLVYKVVLSGLLYLAMNHIPHKGLLFTTVSYMYLYTFYLFFDFAGYSLMAVGVSNIMGIQTPMNFNKPFLSIDIKDFWNRWHISLSTWLRDFIFSRIVMKSMRHKWFKTRLTTAMVAYMLNMIFMGFWHGLSWSYIIYGVYHGVLMAGFEWYQKKSKFYKKYKQKTAYKVVSWFVTMHLVMIGLLIFSEKPYEFIIKLLTK